MSKSKLDVDGLTEGSHWLPVLEEPVTLSIAAWFDAAGTPDFMRAATVAHHEAGPSPWFPLGHERDLSKQITEADFNAALNAASSASFA